MRGKHYCVMVFVVIGRRHRIQATLHQDTRQTEEHHQQKAARDLGIRFQPVVQSITQTYNDAHLP